MSLNLQMLISPDQIAGIVAQLAQTIDQDYQGRNPVLVGVLKGSFIFLADLVRALQTPVQRIELMRLSSYGAGTSSAGTVQVLLEVDPDLVRGQDIILVEDIVDTGRSTALALQMLSAHQPRSLTLCALLDKPDRREVPVQIDYLGMTIPNRFIVGYGIDMAEQYRQLPGIYTVEAGDDAGGTAAAAYAQSPMM